jgi:sugar/nucleoside kinase (ribokinase family)
MNNRIAAVGTINRDTIHLPGGEKHESYGGLLYSIYTLAQLTSDDFEIVPILNLGKDTSDTILKLLSKYKKIKTSGIKVVPAKNNHCNLYYLDKETKSEILKGAVPALMYENLKPALECSLTVIDFISGNDIDFEALEKFRRDYRGKIYMDIHSLTLGKKENGERFLRKPPDWKRYAACADYLQMNQREFELLSETSANPENVREFYQNLGMSGPIALNITLGERGSYLVHHDFDKLVCEHIAAPRVEIMADTTGCGDVFGAAFTAALCKGYANKLAAWTANQKASENCRYAGIENLNLDRL